MMTGFRNYCHQYTQAEYPTQSWLPDASVDDLYCSKIEQGSHNILEPQMCPAATAAVVSTILLVSCPVIGVEIMLQGAHKMSRSPRARQPFKAR
jgi:hypothetical protein